MKLQKVIAFLITVVMVSSLAVGCGNTKDTSAAQSASTVNTQTASQATSTAAPKEKQKISFCDTTSGDQLKKDATDKSMAALQKLLENEVTIDYQDIGSQKMSEYIKLKNAAGDVPDIFVGDSSDFDTTIAMELPNELKEMSSIPQFGTDKEGKFYLMPRFTSAWGIFYNKDYFTKANITAAPKTWDELMQDCEKLKTAGIAPFDFPLKDGSIGFFLLSIFGSDVSSNVADWPKDRYDGKVKFDSPEWRGIYDKFRTMIEKGYVDKNSLSYTSAGGQEAFAQGKAAMMGILTPAVNAWKDSQYNFGFFPTPGNADANTITVSGGNGLLIRKDLEGDKLAAAVKVIKEYFNPEAYKYLLDWAMSASAVKGYDYSPKAPSANTQGIMDDISAAQKVCKTVPLFGSAQGYSWYDAWGDCNNVIAEMFAGKKLTNDQIVKRLDADYQKGFDSAQKAAANAKK